MSDARQRAVEIARGLEARGQTDGAIELFVRAEAWEDAARVLSGVRRFAEAAQLLMQSLGEAASDIRSLAPDQKKRALHAAICFARAGEVQTAVDLFVALDERQRAVELLQKSGDAVGAAKLQAQAPARRQGAFSLAQRPVASHGIGGAPVTLEAAKRLEASGKAELAMQAYIQLKQFAQAARLARQLGRVDKAGELYAEGGEPFEAGRAYLDFGDTGRALDNFIRVQRADPNYRAAAAQAVRLAIDLNHMGFQLEHFLSGFIAAGPQSERELELFHALSGLYQRHDFAENAKEVLRKILEVNPGYRDARARLDAMEAETRGSDAVYARILKQDAEFAGDERDRNARRARTLPPSPFGGLPDLPELPSLPPQHRGTLPHTPTHANPNYPPAQTLPHAPPGYPPAPAQMHPGYPPAPGQAHPGYPPAQTLPHGPGVAPGYGAPPPYAAQPGGPQSMPTGYPAPAHHTGMPAQPGGPQGVPTGYPAPAHHTGMPAFNSMAPMTEYGRQVDAAVEQIASGVAHAGRPQGPAGAPAGGTLFEVKAGAAPQAAPAAEQSFTPGSVILGRYRVEQKLGQGGMATVFRVSDLELGEEVALKLFNQALADEQTVARFKLELKLSRQLAHPNVVRLFDMGVVGQNRFITMELLTGSDLKHRLGKPLPIAQGIRYLQQACAGLQAAHELGIVHRDVKPDNFFVTLDDALKVMDFGIAKGQTPGGLTVAGMIAGTPEYMSPEQINNFGGVGPATDLYSLGVVAFEIFTGKLPFRHAELMPLLMMHLQQAPPSPRSLNPQLPEDLDGIILRCMAKNPAQRFGSCRELAAALEQVRVRYEVDL